MTCYTLAIELTSTVRQRPTSSYVTTVTIIIAFTKHETIVQVMSDQTIPPAPEDVPEELCAEILNLDEETLGKLHDWFCRSFPSQQEPSSKEELSNIAEATTNGTEILANLSQERKQEIDVSEMLGTFTWQFFQCSNEKCPCTSGQTIDLHGPYLQRFIWMNQGITPQNISLQSMSATR